MKIEYRVGDTIEYDFLASHGIGFWHEPQFVKVLTKEPNVKYGRPGFSGLDGDGTPVFGYDTNVVRVVETGIRKD